MKDLFLRLFQEHSRFDYSYFYSDFIQRLPYRFLEGALTANPSIGDCTGFEELHSLLKEPGRRWKNPELYPFLNYLLIPSSPALQESIDALRIHVGLAELALPQANIRRFWRIRNLKSQTLEVANGRIFPVDVICQGTGQEASGQLVYKPHPSLFSDLNATLYKGERYAGDAQALVRLTCHAINLLTRYSPEIATSFGQEIATIAYFSRESDNAGGFSLRNYYIGGIFVSISDPITVAEQFLHEYYHQRIWPWWMIEKPADLPGNEVTIVSPVTGRSRQASVMIQALLIYRSLADYYQFVLSNSGPGEFGDRIIDAAARRHRQIQAGILPLVGRLQEALVTYPKSLEIVEFIMSQAVASQALEKVATA